MGYTVRFKSDHYPDHWCRADCGFRAASEPPPEPMCEEEALDCVEFLVCQMSAREVVVTQAKA